MDFLKKIDWIKWLIILLGAWLFIYSYPYKILVTLLILIPVATIFIHGVINKRPSVFTLLDGVLENKSNFSPVAHILWVTIPLGFRVFMDYEPENTLVMIGVSLLSMVVFTLFTLTTHKPTDKNNEMAGVNYLILGLLFLFFSSTAMFSINCLYDTSEPKIYQVNVLDTFKTGRSHKSGSDYQIKVKSWTNDSESVNIEVPSEKYYSIEEGDSVNVHVRNGLFRVGWYYIE